MSLNDIGQVIIETSRPLLADLYRDSENGQWVDFIRKGKGTGYNDPEQVLRLRAQNVAEIERLQD